MSRDKEYDAFGPWIIAINETDQIPPKFIECIKTIEDFELLLKFPVNVDRRDIRPGMDMYKMIIGVTTDHVHIFEQVGQGVVEKVIKGSEIYSMVVHQNLLAGHLYIQIESRRYDIEFNTVSMDTIMSLVQNIRGMYRINRHSYGMTFLDESTIKELDHYYQNEWLTFGKREEHPKIIGLQPITKLRYQDNNPLMKTYHKFMKSHLKSCLYVTNDYELILSKNGEDFAEFRKADYAISYTFIPLNRIDYVRIETHSKIKEIETTVIGVGNLEYLFHFHQNNPHKNPFTQNLRSVADLS